MSLNKALEDLKFDKRLTELNVRLGRITEEDIKKNDSQLEDLSAQVETIDIENSDNSSSN